MINICAFTTWFTLRLITEIKVLQALPMITIGVTILPYGPEG